MGTDIIISQETNNHDILLLLGKPDASYIIESTQTRKWIYIDHGIHITFINNKVTDITFT